MPSDIQIFVKFHESTVFAGEPVSCTITFRNVANLEPEIASPNQWTYFRSKKITSPRDTPSYPSSPRSPARRGSPLAPPTRPKFHKASSSLGLPVRNADDSGLHVHNKSAVPGAQAHKRSVSIVSLGKGETSLDVSEYAKQRSPRPGKGHRRSASLQVLPGMQETSSAVQFPFTGFNRHSTQHSHLPESGLLPSSLRGAVSPPLQTHKNLTSGGLGASSVDKVSTSPPTRQQPSPFKFPPIASQNENGYRLPSSPTITAPKAEHHVPDSHNFRYHSQANDLVNHLAPVARIISGSSIQGSARSSTELYALSNQSTDTVASDYMPFAQRHPQARARHGRHFSSADVSLQPNGSQTLLMGYAQVSASFELDASLVDQSSFDEVKRKGIVGGQGGGGVVGVERPRSSTFLGSLGWPSFGESLGSMLNGGERSSIQEMRGTAASKSIPLLSTPQSLLFVDLRLVPGEERTFRFSFTLPKGLPASHKGKAMKVVYNLNIGTQRGGPSTSSHQVQRVSIPFRVFSSVDVHGEILGHDLMHPYVQLSDTAEITSVGAGGDSFNVRGEALKSHMDHNKPAPVLEFLGLVENMSTGLTRPKLPQPSSPALSSSHPTAAELGPTSSKDIIDLAILRSNQATAANRSANRFEIARNGRAIAVIILNRPSQRLGETITAAVDFSKAELPCYSLKASLESAEKVNPAIALRSAPSIDRATRRIYASLSEAALYACRVVFNATIPISASPTILTSGVSLEWNLRFEFSTTKVEVYDGSALSENLDSMTRASSDERGVVRTAKEHFRCETIEVVIPITVYGEFAKEVLSEEAHCLVI